MLLPFSYKMEPVSLKTFGYLAVLKKETLVFVLLCIVSSFTLFNVCLEQLTGQNEIRLSGFDYVSDPLDVGKPLEKRRCGYMQPKILPKFFNFCTSILKKIKKSIQNLPVPAQKRFDAVLGVWKGPNPIFDPPRN